MPIQINQEFVKRLIPVVGEDEALAILRILKAEYPDASHQEFLEQAVRRLEASEPLQYILEKAHFMGLDLFVNQNVLIPRPETEELVDWVLKSELQESQSVLDLCTGSGCIALALGHYGKWKTVAGLDVSAEALKVATLNADRCKLQIHWIEGDLLQLDSLNGRWNQIVSNPPYVLPEEAEAMQRGVLDFEPALALFTPTPILFYEHIGRLAWAALLPGGSLYFELNPVTAFQASSFLESLGFEQVEIKKDMQGKDRMLKARKPA